MNAPVEDIAVAVAWDAERWERLARKAVKSLDRVLHLVPYPPPRSAGCICPACEAGRVLDEAREMGVEVSRG